MISVLIPAFRAESFISRAVTSVLTQEAQDFEIIIASDDGQDYIDLLRGQGISDARLRCVSTGGIGRGAGAARSAALREARGGIIANLDADDAFLPRHMARMAALAKAYGMAICQVEYMDHASGAFLPNQTKPYASGLLALEDVLLACLHTYAPIVFNRSRIAHEWNEAVPLLEDVVFLAQCYDALPAIWYESSPSYRYYRRADSVCNAPHAPQRFIGAGHIILKLIEEGEIDANPHTARVLKAYIARNEAVELAFKGSGLTDYQAFMAEHRYLLHAPLL